MPHGTPFFGRQMKFPSVPSQEQRENHRKPTYWLSTVGFLGYDKMQAIEDKAKDLAESSAKKAFSEELKELQQKHNQEYLIGTVKPTVSKEIEEAMVSFTDQKVAQIDEIEKKINLLEPAVAELNRRIKPQGTPQGTPSQPQPEPQPFGNKPVSKGGES